MPKEVPVKRINIGRIREKDPLDREADKIRDEYLDAKSGGNKSHAGYAGTIGPADKLRAHILAMSLFPNVYNGHLLNPSS